MDHPEGAGLLRADRVDFDTRVRLEFRGTQFSSDGGLLVMRDLDDAFGLSDRKFRDNEVRLQLHALAYNLLHILRCIELPEAMANWSLTSLPLKLIKIGARVLRHARAVTCQLAEVAVTGSTVRAILAAIRRLRALPSCVLQRPTPKLNESCSRGLPASLKKSPSSQNTALRGPLRSVPAVARAAGNAQAGKGLSSNQLQAIFMLGVTPLGEYRLMRLRQHNGAEPWVEN